MIFHVGYMSFSDGYRLDGEIFMERMFDWHTAGV